MADSDGWYDENGERTTERRPNTGERTGRDPNELGALWIREDRNGRKYMTGTVNGQDIVVFENTKKTNERAPDFRILKSRPRQGNTGQ